MALLKRDRAYSDHSFCWVNRFFLQHLNHTQIATEFVPEDRSRRYIE